MQKPPRDNPQQWGKILLLVAVVLTAISIAHVRASEANWAPQHTTAFVKAVGYMCPALSSNCVSTRSPVLEPTCLTDLPGGYCYHFSCGMVSPPSPADLSR